MKVAFALITAETGKVWGVIEELKKIDEVTEVYSIAGEYDILIKICVSDVKKLGEIIPEKIQKILGIRRTNTLLTFETHKYT
jgi:Lrp/AsnC family transcriptional regulator for asnA, asnC and gidA